MVNILAGRGIVPEFIQHEACVDKILPAALDLIAESPARETMLRDLTELRASLGGDGASQRAAEEIMTVATKERHA
jgi:lipid-A-disaccharide synthase